MDIIPNVNPKPTGAAAKPAAAAPAPAAKKPTGPVMEQRKVVAAQKTGMIVDARLYGVKPMDLAKFINTMIKPGPYSGYVYNQKMMNIANISLMYTKTLSADIKNIAVSTEKLKSGVGSAFGKIIGIMSKGNVISEREMIEKNAKEQDILSKNPKEDPAYKELVLSNAYLHALVLDGEDEKKEIKKHKGGGSILGFLKNLPDVIMSVFKVPILGPVLAGLIAGGLGVLITKLFGKTAKALWDVFAPTWLKDFVKGVQGFFQGVQDFFGNMFKKGGDPFGFIGKRLSESMSALYDWFKEDFIKPIVQNIGNMVEDVGWQLGHLWDKAPGWLGGKNMTDKQVQDQFDEMVATREKNQTEKRLKEEKPRKSLGDIWFRYGTGAEEPAPITEEQQKQINEKNAEQQKIYKASNLRALPQDETTHGEIANIGSMTDKTQDILKTLAKKYKDAYKEDLDVLSAKRTKEQADILRAKYLADPEHRNFAPEWSPNEVHYQGKAFDVTKDEYDKITQQHPEWIKDLGLTTVNGDIGHFQLANAAAEPAAATSEPVPTADINAGANMATSPWMVGMETNSLISTLIKKVDKGNTISEKKTLNTRTTVSTRSVHK